MSMSWKLSAWKMRSLVEVVVQSSFTVYFLKFSCFRKYIHTFFKLDSFHTSATMYLFYDKFSVLLFLIQIWNVFLTYCQVQFHYCNFQNCKLFIGVVKIVFASFNQVKDFLGPTASDSSGILHNSTSIINSRIISASTGYSGKMSEPVTITFKLIQVNLKTQCSKYLYMLTYCWCFI